MATYLSTSDLNAIFGSENIQQWADLNNNDDATEIAARIVTGITYSEALFKTYVEGSRYAWPPTTDPVIVRFLAIWAGDWLYNNRGQLDVDDTGRPISRLTPLRRFADHLCNQFLHGGLRVDSPAPLSDMPTGPVVV